MRSAYHEIIPGLFLGSELVLVYPKRLQDLGITHLLSMNNYRKQIEGFTLKTIDIDDDEDEDISQYFEECINYIANSSKILVFCTAGRSRSVTIVCAYLMKTRNMTLKESLGLIRKVRSVNPNRGFIRQLEDWELKVVCPLCKLEKLTHWFLETDKFAVIECEQCDFPMIVYKKHTMEVSKEDRDSMQKALGDVANQVFGNKRWRIDTVQRTYFEHLHWHARPVLIDFKL